MTRDEVRALLVTAEAEGILQTRKMQLDREIIKVYWLAKGETNGI